MKKNIVLIFVLFGWFCSYGQNYYKTIAGTSVSIDSISYVVNSQIKALNVSGLSLGLITDNEFILKQNFGYQNYESQKPINDNNLFEAASMSKPIFAWLIMKLTEKGIIDLDKPLFQYYHYPDIAHDDRHKAITARLVLTHQTGLPNWRYGGPLTINFEPGSDFSYSGEGYVYLGKVIEHLLQMPLEQIFQQEVFQPLGMQNSTMIWSPSLNIKKAFGHYNGNVLSTDYYRPLRANPAASLHTNIEDFSKFILAVLNYKGLKQKSYDEMFRIQVTLQKGNSHQNEDGTIHWGLGWVIEKTPHGLIYQHGGNNGDFESYFQISLDKKSGYVYFSNSDKGDELNKSLKPLLTSGTYTASNSNKLTEEYQIPINAQYWQVNGLHAAINYKGKEAAFLNKGELLLKDSLYKNLIVEFDVAFPKDYGNVGLHFRGKNGENYESFYLRTHESGTSQSMQYTPVFNGVPGWQLYSGYNYTGRTTHLRQNNWNHVRMAIFDDWMEVYIDDMDHLALHVFDLKYAIEKGYVALWTDNIAYFSNFRIKEIDSYNFYYNRQPKPKPPIGTITTWDVSEPFDNRELYPSFVDSLKFQRVQCEYNGLVNLAKFAKIHENKNTVLARVNLISSKKQRKSIQFGYSDIGKIYLNNEILYDGQRVFQSRDNHYWGTIGYYQRIYIDLQEGNNELWFVITENFGGWGLMMKLDDMKDVKIEN